MTSVFLEMKYVNGGARLVATFSDSSTHYINYKALKKQINAARNALQASVPNNADPPELTGSTNFPSLTEGFFYELDRNVESVDGFFTKKSTDIKRRFKLLIDKYGDSGSDQLDYHELDDLVCQSTLCPTN